MVIIARSESTTLSCSKGQKALFRINGMTYSGRNICIFIHIKTRQLPATTGKNGARSSGTAAPSVMDQPIGFLKQPTATLSILGRAKTNGRVRRTIEKVA